MNRALFGSALSLSMASPRSIITAQRNKGGEGQKVEKFSRMSELCMFLTGTDADLKKLSVCILPKYCFRRIGNPALQAHFLLLSTKIHFIVR